MRANLLLLIPFGLCSQLCSARKNVLLIIVDDLRPEIGVYQDESNQYFSGIKTPNMDALAARSFVAKRAHVQQAVCSPSRASFLTGRRPDTTKTYRVAENFRHLGGNFTSLPQYFKQKGYATAGFGKVFHNAKNSEDIDEISWTEPYFKTMNKDKWKSKVSWKAASATKRLKYPLPDETIATAAVETINRLASKNNAKPFMLAVGFTKPHLPFIFPEEMFDLYPKTSINLPNNPYVPSNMPSRYAWSRWAELRKYQDIKGATGLMNDTLPDDLVKQLRRAYFSCVSFTDMQIGRVLQAVSEQGLNDDTIIALIGDHGYLLGEHGAWAKHSNFGLATRAPFMVSVPGLTDDSIISNEMVEFVDLFPTLVEAAGLGGLEVCPDDSTDIPLCVEGSSLMPLITNNASVPWKDIAFSQYPRTRRSTKKGVMGYSMTTQQYRYTEWKKFIPTTNEPRWNVNYSIELYDLTSDPDENHNVAEDSAYLEIRRDLQEKLRAGWRAVYPGGIK
ncbi:hypothetical protein CAPTEDRAFT_197493 [Capitella teleta]|uniref:Sulfatase N-terminal domain-containing protein n=1 Tax=Capitella teleta TaxID=283909 RepID=R7TG02_CAPTE|nr:hypothetical protein CAPTEDRAFT_197493 [Capitella teleta]|eukprot:ELT90471.1 hypothetical protein CAPTEDRAFT_197493 [Capitella teleta]